MTIMIPAWTDGRLEPVEKLEVHLRGLRHKAVSVFVLDGDKVLLQQRALEKYHTPGLWANTCCTHPGWNEAPLDCANRRLNEELGITGLAPVHRDTVEYRADVGNDMIEHEVVDIFAAEAGESLPLVPNPNEVMATRWSTYADLVLAVRDNPSEFTPWLRIYLEEHSHKIFGK